MSGSIAAFKFRRSSCSVGNHSRMIKRMKMGTKSWRRVRNRCQAARRWAWTLSWSKQLALIWRAFIISKIKCRFWAGFTNFLLLSRKRWWCTFGKTFLVEFLMIFISSSKKEGISLPKFFAKIFLHLSFIFSLVRFTTIVSIGLLCKTLLTSMFKLKVVSSLFVSKDSTSISLSSNFLSLLGNLTIILLNLAQSGLSQIYFNAGVSLSLDLIIISLTIMYASVKKNV